MGVLFLLSLALPCGASVVVDLGGAPGIVAQSHDEVILDYLGQVWGYDTDRYVRMQTYDPPVPVSDIRFWTQFGFVTRFNEVWDWRGDGFRNCGPWPGLPAATEEAGANAVSAGVSPNPSVGPCRIVFELRGDGPVTVEIVDATGRLIRRLLDGPHPAGDYSLIWDSRDDDGREVPAGVYFTRVTTREGTVNGRVVIAR